MLSQSIPVEQPISRTSFAETIQSRFGEISLDSSRLITFPRGLLGMPDKTNFGLTNFSGSKMEQFKLLQSLDEVQLSFITLPVAVDNPIIAAEDILSAAADLQIFRDDLVVLLIVSVHRSPDNVRLSVNSRAPLFLDVKQKFGMQYVFHNDEYKVQHML
ncbi:MAG: flagellar assembly protein FliW [Rickettsiales bacterium]|jgi:flagellar assembly factor FliW